MTERPTLPASQDSVQTTGSISSERSNGPDYLNKANFERLGRQRPAILKNRLIEIGFVFTIVMSMMMAEFFISGFNIILPHVSEDLHMADSAKTWPAGVTNLTTAALLLPLARLCDMYGGRFVFLGGHIWLLIWSVVSGFSQNSTMLIVCRAMQGMGSAAYLPAGLALLGCTYRPGPRKNLIFSIYGAFACIGFYFGIFLGAITAELLDWRWYFWLGAIIVAIIVFGGIFFIPRHLDDTDPNAKMDWLGVVTIVPGLVLVVYAFTDGGHAPNGWATPYIYVTFIIGILFLLGAVYIQGWVSAQPLLPKELFHPKYMTRLITALFCAYGVFGIYLFYASFYIETVLDISPLLTAAWFTPFAVGGMVLAVMGGFVLHIIPNRILMIISGLGFIISVLLFALIPEKTASGGPSNSFIYWAYVFPAMLCGTIGVDITFNVTNVYITTAMPRRLQAAASGLINSLLYLGIAFWLGIADLAVATAVKSKGEENLSKREQYKIAFWTGLGVAGMSLLFTVSIRMGQASAGMTADEKAEMEREQMRQAAHGEPAAGMLACSQKSQLPPTPANGENNIGRGE